MEYEVHPSNLGVGMKASYLPLVIDDDYPSITVLSEDQGGGLAALNR